MRVGLQKLTLALNCIILCHTANGLYLYQNVIQNVFPTINSVIIKVCLLSEVNFINVIMIHVVYSTVTMCTHVFIIVVVLLLTDERVLYLLFYR